MSRIIEEVKGLYKVIDFRAFRKTKGVIFDLIPVQEIGVIGSIDRVLHDSNAFSPGRVEDVERPWYMHPYQKDNLVVLNGIRYVDIYTPQHGKIESFTVTPNSVYRGDKLIADEGAMLVWSKGVFHRIISGEGGSASINLAVHYTGYDIKTNFNIYDVDTTTGEYKIIRDGFLDQH